MAYKNGTQHISLTTRMLSIICLEMERIAFALILMFEIPLG